MGLMRFVIENKKLLTESRLSRSYVASGDEVAMFCRLVLTDDHLVVERSDSGSVSFATPWPIPGHGDWLLTTTCLMERERPYQLEVELARGLVFKLRDQLAVWEHMGLIVPDELREATLEATQAFARSATRQDDSSSAAEHAVEAIRLAADAACQLTKVYTKQAISIRQANVDKLSTLQGVCVAHNTPSKAVSKEIQSAFNLISVPCGWGSVEPNEAKRDWSVAEAPIAWAKTAGTRVCCGPLLEFHEKLIPDWAYLWEGDFSMLSSLMISHVNETVRRYKGKVQLWNVASQINNEGVLSLSDEQRLQIVAQSVQEVRKIDPKTPIVIGINQPWGEYRGRKDTELSPLDFADALERSDLGIAGFNLELNIGYQSDSTALRNPLAMSRLIDLWSVRIETPLMLTVTLPSSSEVSDAIGSKAKVVLSEETPAEINNEWQAQWARERIPMLMAKNAVQVVIWNELLDSKAKLWPNSGLYDQDGKPKPILKVFEELRRDYLA